MSAPPQRLGLSPFYQKYLDANGIPIIGSVRVPDQAIGYASLIVKAMLSKRADLIAQLKKANVKVAVMARSEKTTDIPEHADLNRVFPIWDWNERARGVSATEQRPITSCAEENILQYPDDRYRGECILVHEFSHTLLNMAVAKKDPSFLPRLTRAFEQAKRLGLWQNTYANSNVEEYWAEGAQDWFDCNLHCSPANGIHNEIYTQAQLRLRDPALFQLLSEIFPSNLKWDGKSSLVPR